MNANTSQDSRSFPVRGGFGAKEGDAPPAGRGTEADRRLVEHLPENLVICLLPETASTRDFECMRRATRCQALCL